MTQPFLQSDQIIAIEKLATKSETETIRWCANVLLLYNAGKKTREISAVVGVSTHLVRYWRKEFQKQGMDLFSEVDLDHSRKTSSNKTTPSAGFQRSSGLEAGDSMSAAGRKTLRIHFDRMVSRERGTRLGEDIEELHNMRVATRRMRAALEIFGPYFKSKEIKNLRKGLRTMGKALGRVRDLDVFMENTGLYLESLPEDERSGLEPILKTWQQERKVKRHKLLAYLDSTKYQRFKQDIIEFSTKTRTGPHPDFSSTPIPDLVRHTAPVLVYSNLGAVRAYENIIANAATEQLHALRIEFKKLRYTFEFFREVLGPQSKQVILNIKNIQDHLGALNDAAVACQILRRFIETWDVRKSVSEQKLHNPQPVRAYLSARRLELDHLRATFPQAWALFNRKEFLENVALSISVL